MPRFPRPLVLALFAAAVPATAWPDDGEERSPAGVYSTFGVQRASADFDNLSSAINLHGAFGVNFGPIAGTLRGLGLELEFAQTIRPGRNAGAASPLPPVGGGNGGLLDGIVGDGNGNNNGNNSPRNTVTGSDLRMQVLGAYLAYRTPTTVYGVAKLGYAYTDTNIPELDDDRSNFAFQIGGGFRYGRSPIGVELLYARYSSDVSAATLMIGTDFDFR